MCGPKRIVTRKRLILEVTQYGHSRIFDYWSNPVAQLDKWRQRGQCQCWSWIHVLCLHRACITITISYSEIYRSFVVLWRCVFLWHFAMHLRVPLCINSTLDHSPAARQESVSEASKWHTDAYFLTQPLSTSCCKWISVILVRCDLWYPAGHSCHAPDCQEVT